LFITTIAAGVTPAQAGTGALDPTFSADGKVTTDFGGRGDFGNSVVLQPDGKIVVAGQSSDYSAPCCNHDIGVARYHADGSLDTSFDIDGRVITGFGGNTFGNSHEVAYSVVLQPDGKIVVAGYSASFSSSGGNADFALVRYNSSGSLDTTFDGDGKVTTDFSGGEEFGAEVLLQPDGKILVAGSRSDGSSHTFALARYNGNGSLDTTFDMDGKVTTDFGGFDDAGEEVLLQPDGRILVAGTSNNGTDNDFALARYNGNGSLDTTFDMDGKLTTDFGYNDLGAALLLQTNGRILVVGNSVSDSGDNYGFALARYNSNGSPDSTFDLDGKVIPVLGSNSYDGAAAAALQPDGKIFVAGRTGTSSDFTLVRYNSNGSLDAAFGTNGKVITSIGVGEDYGEAIALLPDGRIVLAGESFEVGTDYNFALVRYGSAQTHALSVTLAGNGRVTSAPAGISCGGDCSESYASDVSVNLTAIPGNNAVFSGWSGACSGNGSCVVSMTAARSVSASFTVMPTNTDIFLQNVRYASFYVPPHRSRQASFTRVNRGPVRLVNTENNPMIAAERMIYKVNGVNTSFSEIMGLPQSQVDTTFWLPWYNNVDLDTQLRVANVSGSQATVTVIIGGVAQPSFNLAAGASTRLSYPVNNGPVKIVSTQNIVAAERVIYKVNGINTSFTEMMALPQKQLDNVYYLPWYNNIDLDTQLRIANVSGSPATVTVTIGGVAQPSFHLAAGESTRLSYPANNGPVRIESTQDIVAAERVIYKVNGINTSFSEMMALPASQLDKTYWLPWYNNVDLDTQLRIGNVSGSPAAVTITIGGTALHSFNLAVGQGIRLGYPANNGPVGIASNQNIIAAERVIYKVNGVNTGFTEMMGLPNLQLDTMFWLPWYNNLDLDTQLRFGIP
jgi:uncharacterized delta-60 repeat protein